MLIEPMAHWQNIRNIQYYEYYELDACPDIPALRDVFSITQQWLFNQRGYGD
jgi:hypothetical protein